MHGMGKRAQALRVALGWGWPDHPGSRILGEWCYGGGGLGWWTVGGAYFEITNMMAGKMLMVE